MRFVRNALLAAAACTALLGLSVMAEARDSDAVHTLTVQLPDGGAATIRYTGDGAPKVTVASGPAVMAAFAPAMFGPNFAELDRICAEMDRQMAARLQQARSLAAMPLLDPNRPIEANFGHLPAGSTGTSVISTTSGNGACTQSVRITYSVGGAPPQVVTSRSGNCGPQTPNAAPAKSEKSHTAI